MIVWRYVIHNSNGKTITKNPFYAEKRSKLGDIVFCKRETNIYKRNNFSWNIINNYYKGLDIFTARWFIQWQINLNTLGSQLLVF